MKNKNILMLHGWMHSAARYQPLKDELAEYEGGCYEFPGFGDTPPVFKGRILDCYAKELAIYLRTHETDLIIAHSMGGAVLLRTLNRYLPEEEYTVILLNPVYGGVPKLLPAVVLLPAVWAGLWILRHLPFSFSRWVYRVFSLATINHWKNIDELISIDAKKADPFTAAFLLAEMALDRFSTGLLKSHIWLVVSGKDRILSRKSLKRLRHDLGGCGWIEYPRTGHTPVAEAFDKVLEDIRRVSETDDRMRQKKILKNRINWVK